MTRGQDQINSALAHIAGAAGQASLEADARQRLDSVSGDLQSLLEVIFVKSALCVPFTAACDRAAKAVAAAAAAGGDIGAAVARLEKAARPVRAKSTGAGGAIIT